MKRICSVFVLLIAFSMVSNSAVSIIPRPNQMNLTGGNFVFKDKMTIKAPINSRAKNLLALKLTTAAGISLKEDAKTKNPSILLILNPSENYGKEAYSLSVTKNQVKIEAGTENGLYYGVQTLLQLFPPQIESPSKTTAVWQIPCVEIKDAPRFSYRGIMLDCCRHFLSIDEIKKILDTYAMYKINVFHWHLTEDQAWRIEIKQYPKLTEIGSVRMENGKPYGGFYTQEQIKDMIKYAADRNIEIIPEIEMPGHALAALSAYPQYSCTGGPFKPRTIWGIEEDVYCAGNEETYKFLQNILDEVCALFPSKYVHLGGDECPKSRWKQCPKCQAAMKANGLKDEMELQSYFTKRMEKYLETKGKRLIGWDEILEGGISSTATVMSWRGEKGGIDAANSGHDVVMTPGGSVYLDYYQGDLSCENVKIGGLSTLQHVYEYDPVPQTIDKEKAHHVLGLQGNLWHEYLYDSTMTEYQLYPRITAISEVGWTMPENKNTDDFVKRIDDQQIRWDLHNINYYIPMPEENMNFIHFSDTISLSFSNNRPVKVVYTLNNSEPTNSSTEYKQPIFIDKSLTLKIRSVLPQGKLSPVRTIQLTKTEPYKGIQLQSPQKGLKMHYVEDGNFSSVEELSSVSNWKDTIVGNVNDFFKWKKNEELGGAAIFDGYICVEKEGYYILHCLADELYLNGKLLIVNDKMKKNATTDITLPLTKGYYPIKIVLLNRSYGGVISQWVNACPTLRPIDNSNRIFPTQVYY